MILRGCRLLSLFAIAAGMMAGMAWAGAAAGTPNTWSTVAPLPEGRMNPAAAGADGRLYVFGGGACATNFCRTFYAYSPRTNRWALVGNMPEALNEILSATTGRDGRIYLYGGIAFTPTQPGGGATMLVYDPRANRWTRAAPPPGVQDSAELVTGPDGRIFSVGGRRNGDPVGTLSAYSPRTGRWTALKPNPAPRISSAAAMGPNGRIYVIGGDEVGGQSAPPDRVEAYTIKTNSWSQVASLPTPRAELQAVTGPDGRVYALGGGAGSRCPTVVCRVVEAYDVRSNRWTEVAPMPHARWLFAAAVGPDGRIYLVGGNKYLMRVSPANLVRTVDTYTVVPAGQPLPTPKPSPPALLRELEPMPTGRQNLMAATGGDGKIYAIGGESIPSPQPAGSTMRVLRAVEAYDPATNTWAKETPLPSARADAATATGPDGHIYVLGGIHAEAQDNPPVTLPDVEIYDPKTQQWSSGTPLPVGRSQLAAVAGKDGRIYAIGGATYVNGITVCEPYRVTAKITLRRTDRPARWQRVPCYGPKTVFAYDPRTNAWQKVASLHVGRVGLAAVVGRDGRIYVFGGTVGNGLTSTSAEVYDPRANRWTPIAPMIHARTMGFAAATGPDGRIYLFDGCVGPPGNGGFYCGSGTPVDAYDPVHNSWQTVGSTVSFRQGLAATTGPDGRIYAMGGAGDGNGRLLEVLPAQ